MRPSIIFSFVYDVLIRKFKALLVNKNAKRFNKKPQMKSFSWIRRVFWSTVVQPLSRKACQLHVR